MRLLMILFAVFVMLYGARLMIIAAQAALTGRWAIREGRRIYWHPAPSRGDAIKTALRDGLMGLLLVVLGWVIIF